MAKAQSVFLACSFFFVSSHASCAWIALVVPPAFAYSALRPSKSFDGSMAIGVLKTKASSPVPQLGSPWLSYWTRWSQGH